MSKLEQAYLDWFAEYDLFLKADRPRFASEFADIARRFGASEEPPPLYKKINGVDGYVGPDIPVEAA